MSIDRGYDPDFFEPLARVEDRHFWFCARNGVIASVCKQLGDQLKPGYRVLEVGCGTGNVLRILDRVCSKGTVYGTDLFREGLRYARRRSAAPLIQSDMHAAPFAAAFDMIGLFDVLEHLPDDMQVLRDLRQMLADGGHLVLTVPAGQSLWSYFDEASHHCRRYELDDLKHKLEAAGYVIVQCTPFMMSLFPLVWLGRRLAALSLFRWSPGTRSAHGLAAQELRIRPGLNEILRGWLSLEKHWIGRQRVLPFGTSLLVVATPS